MSTTHLAAAIASSTLQLFPLRLLAHDLDERLAFSLVVFDIDLIVGVDGAITVRHSDRLDPSEGTQGRRDARISFDGSNLVLARISENLFLPPCLNLPNEKLTRMLLDRVLI